MQNHEELEQCLAGLFRSTYTIHEYVSQLLRQSAILREISINAAIASGHAGHQGKVFSEIAKQIGIISRLLVESVESFHASTGRMSNQMLGAIISSKQQVKMTQAQAASRGNSIDGELRMVILRLGQRVSTLLGQAHLELQRIRPDQERVRLLVNRVWSIVINLRVSAANAERGEEAFFHSIAQALEGMASEASEIAESLDNAIATVDESLANRCDCVKEAGHAA